MNSISYYKTAAGIDLEGLPGPKVPYLSTIFIVVHWKAAYEADFQASWAEDFDLASFLRPDPRA